MTRRALATGLVGVGLALVALLGVIWLLPGPEILLRICLTVVLVAGLVAAALGMGMLARVARSFMTGARGRDERLSTRVDRLSARMDGESAALRELREDVEGIRILLDGEVEGLRLQIEGDRAETKFGFASAHGRLTKLEGEHHSLRETHRSQDHWALEVDTKLWQHSESLEQSAKKAATARRADHERFAADEQMLYDHLLRSDVELTDVLEETAARTLASRFARGADYLRLKPLVENFDVLQEIESKRVFAAFKTYRRYGYLAAQARAAEHFGAFTGRDSDLTRASMISAESRFFEDPLSVSPDLGPSGDSHDSAGPVMHIVGKALPETQTGYTLRTHYTVRAQQERGVPLLVVCQAGAPGGSPEETVENVIDGVRYVMLQGIPRHETTFQEWVADNMRRTAEIVRSVRPSILHAHSDFLNALIATTVGKSFGIPVVYESRGFWEESWLSRTIDNNGLTGSEEDFFRAYGMPEAYTWRQRAEILVRERSDANLTLGRTMRSHIRELARPGTLEEDQIRLVPNGIDPTAFGDVERDESLAASLGLSPGAIVIGCISSIVEYEGIDVLLRAYASVQRTWREASPRPRLLIVGDGDRLEKLRALAGDLGLRDIVFTGRVPHDDVLRYYGLIDIFVVPRKPTPVSRLVTPLKPYEALATGRALVVSDVEALQEIAEDSGGAVEVFPAGDHSALSELLGRLSRDPQRRREMAEIGADWVRRERTWRANSEVYAQVYAELGASFGSEA